MSDLKLLEYLESYLTKNRRERFKKILAQRTKHFTVAVEDVYQLQHHHHQLHQKAAEVR